MGESKQKSKKEKSNEELAEDRTRLAEIRSDLAQNRTLQAAERTYAAWIRTGFTIAGAGWTLGQALQNSESREVAIMIGGALIILGLMCFIYAWFGFRSVFDYLQETMDNDDLDNYPFTMNLTTVTILSVALFIIFVIGFGMLLFKFIQNERRTYMESVLNLFGSIGNFTLPIFVFLTMFNVGITRTLDDFLQYTSEWKFFLRMLVVNFVIAPILKWLILQVFSLSLPLEIGLIIFSMAAGAPFVIKLTQFSEHDIALGATLLIVLVLGTSIVVPIALPMVLTGVEINGVQIFLTLIRQLVLPIILGLILNRFLPDLIETIQPWVGKLSNITLWVVVVGILVGELEGLFEIIGDGAIFASVLFILLITVIGYFLGGKNDKDHQQDLGALGSGQRNTAACMIIAADNFGHIPEVLLIITIANTLGIIMLVGIAKYLSLDNDESVLNN